MTTVAAPAPDTRSPNPLIRLYRGETSFDFVGRRKWWYLISMLVIVAGLLSLTTRGLNLGIDFKGGTSWQLPANGLTINEVTKAVTNAGLPQPTIETLGTGKSETLQVEADLSKLPIGQQQALTNKVASVLGALAHVPAKSVSIQSVGATWGSQITKKAIIAVIVFFIVVVVYISFRFEWKMALAAFIAVLHDLLVTAGVYSLFGFQVTPDTVIAILTILGYSLYDTVVVFDRVRDSTRGLGASGRITYQDVVNLSMNQVLARSINTSLVAILPVLSILVIGAQLLGASTLQYFGLALVIGLTSGAYSSIFIASPILSQLKEREPRYVQIRQKLASRDARTAAILTPAAAAAMLGAGDQGRRSGRQSAPRQGGTMRPAARTGAPAARTVTRQPARAGAPSPRVSRAGAGASLDGLENGHADLDGAADVNEVAGNGDTGNRGSGTAGAGRTGSTNARTGTRTGTPVNRRPPPRSKRKGGGRGKGGKRR